MPWPSDLQCLSTIQQRNTAVLDTKWRALFIVTVREERSVRILSAITKQVLVSQENELVCLLKILPGFVRLTVGNIHSRSKKMQRVIRVNPSNKRRLCSSSLKFICFFRIDHSPFSLRGPSKWNNSKYWERRTSLCS